MKIHGILIVLALVGGAGMAMAQSGTSAGAGLSYTQPLSKPAIRSVQKSLRQLGLYAGHVDGNWGPDSAAAFQQFQQSHGLQVTGQLNEATAKTLDLDVAKLLEVKRSSRSNSANSGQQANVPKGSTLSHAAIRTVQSRLRELNFKVGRVDGIWGADTQKALMKFQKGHALQPTGQLNPATINALGLNSDQLLLNKKQQ